LYNRISNGGIHLDWIYRRDGGLEVALLILPMEADVKTGVMAATSMVAETHDTISKMRQTN
jgi:hypothetical protein